MNDDNLAAAMTPAAPRYHARITATDARGRTWCEIVKKAGFRIIGCLTTRPCPSM